MNLEDLPREDRPSELDRYGPVFVLGCPRSGTTFLSQCLSALPGAREFVGVLAPPRLMHLIARPISDPLRDQLLACIRDIFWLTFIHRVFRRSERLMLLAQRRIEFSEFWSRPSLEGKLFVYKEPFLCFAAEHLAENFPNDKFIQIYRDGRDNADSMIRTYPDALSDEVLSSGLLSFNKVSEIGSWRTVNGFNIPWWVPQAEEHLFREMSRFGRYLRLWREMTERARSLVRVLPRSRVLELKYEEFVQNPVVHGERLRAFLGAPSSAKFVKTLKRAQTRSIGISRRTQSDARRQEAELIAGTLLRDLGYSA